MADSTGPSRRPRTSVYDVCQELVRAVEPSMSEADVKLYTLATDRRVKTFLERWLSSLRAQDDEGTVIDVRSERIVDLPEAESSSETRWD